MVSTQWKGSIRALPGCRLPPRLVSAGSQAPGPSLLHGQLPCGFAAAATDAAGPRAGAHLRGAAPIPSNGPLALWWGTPHCWPSLSQAREWDCDSAPRASRPLPASVLSCGMGRPGPQSGSASCYKAKAPPSQLIFLRFWKQKQRTFQRKTRDLRERNAFPKTFGGNGRAWRRWPGDLNLDAADKPKTGGSQALAVPLAPSGAGTAVRFSAS